MDIKTRDIVMARKKVADKCFEIINLMNDIEDIDDKMFEIYNIDFFNECLPLKEYPFQHSFNEVISEIHNWADTMCELNEKEVGVIDDDNHS